MLRLTNINFSVSGVEHTVKAADIQPETNLNTYLRKYANLTGTKRMCLEGGCGACIVAVEEIVNGERKVFAINSCLVSVFSCHGWKIHTIEGIGNPIHGYHPIQKLLADNNGSQCGFCSPAMVMNMYALHESGPKTMKDIENSFGGNICRCTGYRPILEAFKKLASDAGEFRSEELRDIEDFVFCQSGECEDKCDGVCDKQVGKLNYQFGDSNWTKVYTMANLLELLKIRSSNYMLVAGNTARGVYKNEKPADTYIDITSVYELIGHTVDDKTLVLGANLTLGKTIDIISTISKQKIGFSYLSTIADHMYKVASVPVRNIATLAGNLMVKYKHNEFPSDIFLLLETFKAALVIVDIEGNEIFTSPKDFLKTDMTKRVIKSIVLNSLDKSYRYLTYKIMPRAQNAHAIVNAGFLLKLNNTNTVQSARIVYGGINPQFVHAENTEKFLKSQKLFDNVALKNILRSLNSEILPDHVLPDASPQFRKNLAVALFYKFVLHMAPQSALNNRVRSGGTLLERPVSTGSQEFGTLKQKWPLTEPLVKLEALAQTSGQAEYVDDIPDRPGQLFAAFVTAKAPANSTMVSVDTSKALKMKGVVAYLDKKDIPGENTFTPKLGGLTPIQEELFCSGRVQYYDQPIGIIVAKDHDVALQAAELVQVTYNSPTAKSYLYLRDVVKANVTERITLNSTVTPKSKGNDVKHVIKGEFNSGRQYHFHMEVQCCNVVPTEDSVDIYPATQWMDMTQVSAAAALNLPTNRINVNVRRLGGAFGAKIIRNSLLSTAAAVAAHKLRKPVKLWMPLEKNMSIIGKRIPMFGEYEVGVDDKGVIQYLNAKLYVDNGIGGNESEEALLVMFGSCYDISRWGFSLYLVKTDTYANCWARAPGSVDFIGAVESLMEHIACTLNLEPIDVKLANLDRNRFPMLMEFWQDMQSREQINVRRKEIQAFNENNRWRKKGLALVPMAYQIDLITNRTVLVSIYHGDGGVVISHGGIEVGQGINTKVAQVCAYKFGISMEKVSVKPSYNVISPNSGFTGASMTSETVCYAVTQSCDILLARMKPIRDKMNNPKWEDLVNQCFAENVHLSALGFYSVKSLSETSYKIFSFCATEVEVDILTGLMQILRVDMIQDAGDSMNPLIDIGQLEGAFAMGLGYYTSENIILNQDGKVLTNRTWNYKPPGAKDIPIDFRIKFPKNIPNAKGILNSKALGESPLCLSISVPLAIRHALASARQEADKSKPKWVPFDGPTSVENTFLYSLNNYEQYLL